MQVKKFPKDQCESKLHIYIPFLDLVVHPVGPVNHDVLGKTQFLHTENKKMSSFCKNKFYDIRYILPWISIRNTSEEILGVYIFQRGIL